MAKIDLPAIVRELIHQFPTADRDDLVELAIGRVHLLIVVQHWESRLYPHRRHLTADEP